MIRRTWDRLLCGLRFHPELRVVHECRPGCFKLYCPRCERTYGLHIQTNSLVPWTPEMAVCGTHL